MKSRVITELSFIYLFIFPKGTQSVYEGSVDGRLKCYFHPGLDLGFMQRRFLLLVPANYPSDEEGSLKPSAFHLHFIQPRTGT